MAFNRDNGGAAIVAEAMKMVGHGYSEQKPLGSDGDGHWWKVGEPLPTVVDCSGLVYMSTLAAGCPVSSGAAQDQWNEHRGGVVPTSEPLKSGDIGAFMGVNNIPGYAGHTGIIVTCDAGGAGTLVNAYDTAKGVCTMPFDRHQISNESNGLGVVGFYRPAASLPPAPIPPLRPPPSGRPTEYQLESRQLVMLPDSDSPLPSADAALALKNGWPVFYFAGTGFRAVPAGYPTPSGLWLYANREWRTHR